MAFKLKKWMWVTLAVVLVAGVILLAQGGGAGLVSSCPGSQTYCPGVGCVSGPDKCVPGSVGGPSAVFSREGFTAEPREMKTCQDGTRTDGPCLLDFPDA